MKALLDANFLMIPGKFKLDIFNDLKEFGNPDLYTLDLVVKELQGLSKEKGKDSRNAKLGLELIKKWKVNILETEHPNTDNEILRIAKKGFVVCTQDKELIGRLKENNIKVISMRQKSTLQMQ